MWPFTKKKKEAQPLSDAERAAMTAQVSEMLDGASMPCQEDAAVVVLDHMFMENDAARGRGEELCMREPVLRLLFELAKSSEEPAKHESLRRMLNRPVDQIPYGEAMLARVAKAERMPKTPDAIP